MSRRFRPTDAFVDESIRGQRYLMGCVLIEARHLTRVRRATAALVGEGKCLHFHQELDSMRRSALELFASMPVRVTVVVCARSHGLSEFHARDACLAEIVRSRLSEPSLVFDHRQGLREPLLWVADAVTWAYGAGGRWLPLVGPLLDDVTELRP